jgi:hypothetical protein
MAFWIGQKSNILEEYLAFILRVEEWAKQETNEKLAICRALLGFCFACSLNLKMEVTCSSEVLGFLKTVVS